MITFPPFYLVMVVLLGVHMVGIAVLARVAHRKAATSPSTCQTSLEAITAHCAVGSEALNDACEAWLRSIDAIEEEFALVGNGLIRNR